MADRILRAPSVEDKVGMCERAWRPLEARGEFPKRFLITPEGRAVGWSEEEIDDFIRKRIALRERPAKVGMLKKGGRIVAA